MLESAERLFGDHGLDGVSLRQIGAAAGSGNNYAVQYHFGDAAGLVQAILARRMPAVDARQATLLADAEAHGRTRDTRVLIDIFFRPLLEQRNTAGERSYARFLSALLRSPEGMRHCKALFHLTPMTARILALLHVANPDVPPGLLDERLRLSSIMVCVSVFNRLAPTVDCALDDALIDDALDMAAAALGSPPRAAIRGLGIR